LEKLSEQFEALLLPYEAGPTGLQLLLAQVRETQNVIIYTFEFAWGDLFARGLGSLGICSATPLNA
jgi:hypothetical protein